MASSYRNLLKNIGEDPTREGLLDTPMRSINNENLIEMERFVSLYSQRNFHHRAAKALNFFTKGYQETLREVVKVICF